MFASYQLYIGKLVIWTIKQKSYGVTRVCILVLSWLSFKNPPAW